MSPLSTTTDVRVPLSPAPRLVPVPAVIFILNYILYRVENGSKNGSCPPRLVVGCVGLRSRVCIVQHISAPDGDTSHSIPSPYASPSISYSFARESPPSDHEGTGMARLISPSISSCT